MASKLMEMIEQRTKPPSEENIGKVSSHWKLIRDSVVKGTGEDPAKVDKKASRIVGHGVHKVSKITSDYGFEVVVYNTWNSQYAGISPEGRITTYLQSGIQKHVNKYMNEPLCGLIYATKTRQYVGWGQDDNIQLMSENFKLLSTTSTLSRIFCGVFNEATNEIITGGTGHITCWSFRYGAKYLLQRKALTDGLPKDSKISQICLEETQSRSQKCFAAYDTNVIVHSLLDGKCIAHYKDLHSREITALLFFNPLKYLVTAARDGSIKLWNNKGNIQIIFIGHLKSVNTLAIYPFGPYIMSGSSDNTIRVWSLDTADEVDRIHTDSPVLGLGTIVGKDDLYSFTCTSLYLWKISHVHSVYTTVGSKVKSMKPTTHPQYPVRMVCTCSDATVRLISPGSGACVTSLLVPGMNTITDVVCAAAENLLFTLLSNGTIIKASTKTNPCKILEEWNKESTQAPSTCVCLCLYEYVVEDKLESDQWGDLVTSALKANERSLLDSEFDTKPKSSSYDRTLLLGGCVDGTIVVYDWQNKKKPGRISFKIEGHREEIVTMIANPAIDQVISAGYDNSIKIWRLFPFAEEALAPLMTLYCQETPKHLAVAHHRLLVALHEPATASYNVVVFKTTQKERFDHNSDSDHTDDITSVASCPKMRLFASCSLDGSIRIWDESNHLVRIITLNALPGCLCFSSQKGDLLVGIGNHLHKIEYATYMPRSYIYRMVAMEFQRPVAENPIPIEPEVKSTMAPSDLHRLTQAKSSVFKFERFADLLSQEELDEKAQEEERRSKAFAKIQERENDLKKLRDGMYELQKRKPRPNTELVNQDGFNRYLAIFYKRPGIEIPDEDEFYREKSKEYQEPDTYSPDRQPVGFFAIKMKSKEAARAKKERPTFKKDIMSLSMPEFQPQARPLSGDKEEKEEEEAREFVVSRQGHLEDETDDGDRPEVDSTDRQEMSPRSKSMISLKSKDFKSMAVEPPLIGSSETREQYHIDVPKTERYPSSTMCRHMVAQRATRLVSRTISDDGRETFVIAPDGFIPNSVVVSLFKDLKVERPKEVKEWKPPTLTAEQLAEIEKRKKKREPSPEPPPKKKPPNRFEEQLKLALRDIPSPEPEPEIDLAKSPTPPPTPPPKEPTPPPTPKPSPKKEIKPVKKIEKLITRPKPPTPPPRKPRSTRGEFSKARSQRQRHTLLSSSMSISIKRKKDNNSIEKSSNHNQSISSKGTSDQNSGNNSYSNKNSSGSKNINISKPARLQAFKIASGGPLPPSKLLGSTTTTSSTIHVINSNVINSSSNNNKSSTNRKKNESARSSQSVQLSGMKDQSISRGQAGKPNKNTSTFNNTPLTSSNKSIDTHARLSRSRAPTPQSTPVPNTNDTTPLPLGLTHKSEVSDELTDINKRKDYRRYAEIIVSKIQKEQNDIIAMATRKWRGTNAWTAVQESWNDSMEVVDRDDEDGRCSFSESAPSISKVDNVSESGQDLLNNPVHVVTTKVMEPASLDDDKEINTCPQDVFDLECLEQTTPSAVPSPLVSSSVMAAVYQDTTDSDGIDQCVEHKEPLDHRTSALVSSPVMAAVHQDTIFSGGIDQCVEHKEPLDHRTSPLLSSDTGDIREDTRNPSTCTSSSSSPTFNQEITDCHSPVSKEITNCQSPVSKDITDCASPVSKEITDCQSPFSKEITDCQSRVSKEITNCQSPFSKEITDCQSPVSKEITDCQSPFSKEITDCQSPVSKEITECQSPVSKEITNCQSPVSKEITECQSPVSKEITDCQSPVSKEITDCQSPISKEITDCQSPVSKGITDCQSPVSKKITNCQSPVSKEMTDCQSPVSKEMTDCQSPFSKEITDCQSPVSKEITDCESPVSKEIIDCESPVSKEITNCQSPVSKEITDSQSPISMEMNNLHSSNSEGSKEIFSITVDEDQLSSPCPSVESTGFIQQTISESQRVSSQHVLGPGDREVDSPTSSVYILEGYRQNRRLVRIARQSVGCARRDTYTSLVSPTPPREPTPPPPPPTPLPEFITQFKGTLWFEKFFPDAKPDTFPKPWSVAGFVEILLRILKECSDYELKTQILAAILLLNRQEPFEKDISEQVSRALIAELNVPFPPTAHGPSDAKQFLRVDLQLLQDMRIFNKSFVVELMAQYIDGDEDIRKFIQDLFVSIGIRDPGGYFPKELDSFETEGFVDARRKVRIREVCISWLDKWLSQFKQHIRSLAGKIGRAQAGNVVKGTKEPKTPTSIKGILKKDDKPEASRSQVKFDIESLGSMAADSATPVEAVNYFCEIRMEEELERAKLRSRAKTPPQAKDNSRNTVLVLPKIHSKRSLARLGETHCSHCHPERETSLSLAFPLPPIYKHKKEIPLTNVALHLNTTTINPFPDDADSYLYEPTKHAKLLTLRSSQKYFIPAQSIVTIYDDSFS